MKLFKEQIKDKERKRSNQYRKELKQKYVDYLGGKCTKCGYNKNIKALDFHHEDPIKKSFTISSAIKRKKAWNKVKEELDKCILLCATCHREIHDDFL